MLFAALMLRQRAVLLRRCTALSDVSLAVLYV